MYNFSSNLAMSGSLSQSREEYARESYAAICRGEAYTKEISDDDGEYTFPSGGGRERGKISTKTGTGSNISTAYEAILPLFTIINSHWLSYSQLISQLPGEVEEVNAGAINTVLVNESRSDPAGEDSPLVGLRQSLQ